MADGSLRVVVWSTGAIGSLAIGAIERRSDLDLVGVWVHSADKVGRDAGQLAHGRPNGVETTGDADALIALRPDCVVYAASGPERDAAAVPDYLRFLEAGISVVTATSTQLVHPAAYEPGARKRLEEAARKGGASLYASGIQPGFALDHLTLTLATQSKSIRSIHACEFGMYDDYAVVDIMKDAMGFGQPLDFQPLIGLPGAIAGQFGGQVRLLAEALGGELEEVRQDFDRAVTERPLDVAIGRVEAGTCAALRMKAIGIVGGREAIVIEHVTRLASDVAPHWPSGPSDHCYRIHIEGDPDLECTMAARLDDPESAGIGWMGSGAGAMLATAMRIVNAVPFVVDAAPGLHGALDLPLTLPRNVFDADGGK